MKRFEKSREGRLTAETKLYEYGVARNRPRLRIALGFPAAYKAGMSNLGFLWVWHLFNREEGVSCDRFFYPDAGEETLGGPVTTLDAGRPLNQYDVLAFSAPYEQDYPKIVWLMSRGGVEPVAEKRHGGPLVIAGGVAVSANPEPVADFLDAVVIGEAEPVISHLTAALIECGVRGAQWKPRAVEALAHISGIYVPSLYEVAYGSNGRIAGITPGAKVQAAVERKIDAPAHSVIVTREAAFSGMFLVELSRGCPNRCRFCLARCVGHGFRSASSSGLLEAVQKGLAISNRIGLVGTSFAESASMDSVCSAAAEAGARVSFSSIRITDRALKLFTKWANVIDNGTVAIAPEAASEKMRSVLDKHLEKTPVEFLESSMPPGAKTLKMYYMIGIPGEKDEDIEEIAAEAGEAARIAAAKNIKVSLSVNPMVPKAHTAFQWAGMLPAIELKQRFMKLKEMLPGSVSFSGMSAREAEMQAVLSLGDRRLAPAIAAAAAAGCSISSLSAALKRHGIDVESIAHRRREESEILPWAMIDHGARPGVLWQQYSEAAAYAGISL